MKIIKDGRVYDLDYSKYRTVARLPAGCRCNAVDILVDVKRELRQDVASGRFYVLTDDGRCNGRESVALDPVGRDDAMRIAENYLDYDEYVKFFGDPEGDATSLARERDEALEDKKLAENAKEYWFSEYEKKRKEIVELTKRIEKLKAN